MSTTCRAALLAIALGCAACTAGPVEVTIGDETTQIEPSETQQDVMHFGNALCFIIAIGVVGFFMFLVVLARYLKSSKRSGALGTQGPAVEAGQQGVLTLQFIVAPTVRAAIDGKLPPQAEGPAAVANVARVLQEHRKVWQAVAARGSTLMGEPEASAEANRVLQIFETRASQSGGGSDALLLTIAIRTPFDYCEVMPADFDGFATVLSNLFELDSGHACGYQLAWAGVKYEALDAVVPGLVSV